MQMCACCNFFGSAHQLCLTSHCPGSVSDIEFAFCIYFFYRVFLNQCETEVRKSIWLDWHLNGVRLCSHSYRKMLCKSGRWTETPGPIKATTALAASNQGCLNTIIQITTHGVSYDQLVGNADKHKHTNNDEAHRDLFPILLRVKRALVITIPKQPTDVFIHHG